MSSFRIDRQYVAFETAETQPVFATQKTQIKAEPDSGADTNAAELGRLYSEIYEKLQREHAEQAENMLSKAAEEAKDILDKARRQAEEIVSRAAADAERMKNDLKSEMEESAARRRSEAETGILSLEAKLTRDYTALVDGMRGNIAALVMEIVKKIIGVKLAQSDEVFIGMINDALERLKQTGSVLIRVSPEDYVRYFGKERDDLVLTSEEVKITAVEEPNFSQGDLIVESEGELIDLGINRQIDLIEKAFTS
jgi:flagellar biosynthesis/type III secretory pathway protein FliH